MEKIELKDLNFGLKLKDNEYAIIKTKQKQVGFIPVCRGFEVILTRWDDRLMISKDYLIIASYDSVTAIEIYKYK